MDEAGTKISVEVVYAERSKQTLLSVTVPTGTTIRQVLQASGILELHSLDPLDQLQVGIFGKLVSLEAVVRASDRIEIYRPLVTDPKEARRRRAANK